MEKLVFDNVEEIGVVNLSVKRRIRVIAFTRSSYRYVNMRIWNYNSKVDAWYPTHYNISIVLTMCTAFTKYVPVDIFGQVLDLLLKAREVASTMDLINEEKRLYVETKSKKDAEEEEEV